MSKLLITHEKLTSKLMSLAVRHGLKHLKELTLLVVLLGFVGVNQSLAQLPWNIVKCNYGCCGYNENFSISFNGLNYSVYHDKVFGDMELAVAPFTISNELAYLNSISGRLGGKKKQMLYSIWKTSKTIGSYTSVDVSYRLKFYHSNAGLTYSYASLSKFDSYEDAKGSAVPAYPYQSVPVYTVFDFLYNFATHQYGVSQCQEKWITFTYDNSSGSSNNEINKFLTEMLVSINVEDYAIGENNACISYFQQVSESSSWHYYKHITYNSNQGSGSMGGQKIKDGGYISNNGFSRPGYTFLGWNTKADGTGDNYVPGSYFTVNQATRGVMTLYAQWAVCKNIATDVEYASVQLAVNAAGEGDTICMTQNSTENVAIGEGSIIILDLNGKTLSSNSDNVITVDGGMIKIFDGSAEMGAVAAATGNSSVNVNAGALEINKGKFNGVVTKNGTANIVITYGKFSHDPTLYLDINHAAKDIEESPYLYEVVTDGIVCHDSKHSYTKLQNAINFQTSESDTITMVSSITENVEIISGKDITLDLYGKDITSSAGTTVITNNGKLAVIDGSDGPDGKITGADDGYCGIKNNGELYLYAGEITGNGIGVDVGNDGSLTVGGTVKVASNGPDDPTEPRKDIYLPHVKTFNIGVNPNDPKEGMLVGITTEDIPAAQHDINLSGINDADYSQYFFSNNPLYRVCNYPVEGDNYQLRLTNDVFIHINANLKDGGEVQLLVASTSSPVEDPEHILYETEVTIKAIPTQAWAFAGWYDKNTGELFSGKPTCTFKATECLELEAKFTDNVIWVRVKK